MRVVIRKIFTSSGLCMPPREHATFKLFTLGFVVTLWKWIRKKRKTVRLIVLRRIIIIHLVSGVSTRNICEIYRWVEQLELEVWIGYDCEFLHHTSMKREMIPICVEQRSCKLIGCRTKDKLLKTDKKTKHDGLQRETGKISLRSIYNILNVCSVDEKNESANKDCRILKIFGSGFLCL